MINFFKLSTCELDHAYLRDDVEYLINTGIKSDYDYGSVISIIKKHPVYAYWYTKKVMKCRWLEVEPIIMTDPELAYCYAINIIKDRWLEAEPIIKDSKWWYAYRKGVWYTLGGVLSNVKFV